MDYINNLKKDNYISFAIIRIILILVSFVAAVAMMFMNYDAAYRISICLPIVYGILLLLLFKGNEAFGIGGTVLIGAYGFRMCMLPIFCAYGNFYIEPNQSIYMKYFGVAIMLMCIECIIVMGSIKYYLRRKSRWIDKFTMLQGIEREDTVIVAFAFIAFAVYMCIVLSHKGFLTTHYHILISSVESASGFEEGHVELQNLGAVYYLAVILDIVARPIVSFYLINRLLKKTSKLRIFFAFLVGVMNVLFISDRRILSLLVGVCCFLQIVLKLRNELSRVVLYVIVGFFGVLTVAYCFLGEDSPWRVARKFQRYFSGPSLTAIGVAVYENFFQSPIEFIKLLFNDSLILTGLFDSIPVREYVLELCGPAGYSIWTPMFIGSIQYFHIFAPILIVLVVKFIVYTDFRSLYVESGLKKMMLNYLTVALSIYMVMYSLELVYYNIIFVGGFYYFLLRGNRRFKIRLGT